MISRIFNMLFILTTATFSYAHPGIGLVQDSKGNIYYTDLDHVWKITPQGNRTIAVKNVHTHESQSGWSPCSLLVDCDNTMWIMEFSKQNKTRVVKVNDEGNREIYGD